MNGRARSCLVSGVLSGLSLSLFAACFVGEFVQGLPCSSDEDCGPTLSCDLEQGVCDGTSDHAVCGNGLLEPGEDCDDGNTLDNDACTPDCRAPTCGDGYLGPGEDCDDGNIAEDDLCTPACRMPVCGDGYLGPGEECDDGNDDEDACTSACRIPSCGNMVVEGDEECDDGNDYDGDFCTNACALPACGDGFVGPGEECDDGNMDDSDVCPTTCELAHCGDGFVGPGEVCDGALDSETLDSVCGPLCVEGPIDPELVVLCEVVCSDDCQELSSVGDLDPPSPESLGCCLAKDSSCPNGAEGVPDLPCCSWLDNPEWLALEKCVLSDAALPPISQVCP